MPPLAPFIQAHLKVYRDPVLARSLLTPLAHHLEAGCVSSFSEIFNGSRLLSREVPMLKLRRWLKPRVCGG